MKRTLLVLGFVVLAAQPHIVMAATSATLASHDTEKPVTITADAQDFDLKAKTVTYKGNVVAVQGDIRLHAETMKADQVANKIYADGKVVVDSPASGTATGDNGIYDLGTKLVTLSGHVVLNKTGQATMRGSLLTVNMVSGKAQLTAQPVAGTANQVAAPGLPGGRVQGVFNPKPSSNGGN